MVHPADRDATLVIDDARRIDRPEREGQGREEKEKKEEMLPSGEGEEEHEKKGRYDGIFN